MAVKPLSRHVAKVVEHRKQRLTARERGYTTEWDKARELWLAEHPLCAECERRGELTANKGNHVDHIIPHKGDADLFWDQSNWQTLCPTCHGEKTRRGL